MPYLVGVFRVRQGRIKVMKDSTFVEGYCESSVPVENLRSVVRHTNSKGWCEILRRISAEPVYEDRLLQSTSWTVTTNLPIQVMPYLVGVFRGRQGSIKVMKDSTFVRGYCVSSVPDENLRRRFSKKLPGQFRLKLSWTCMVSEYATNQ